MTPVCSLRLVDFMWQFLPFLTPTPKSVGRSEEGPGYPRHRDYSGIHHGGTDGLICVWSLDTHTCMLTVGQDRPMDGKLKY